MLPPIAMVLVGTATGSRAIGLLPLSDVALAGLPFTASRLSQQPPSGHPRHAADLDARMIGAVSLPT